MARPLRLEFSGALYHVTSRGNRQKVIYELNSDRENFLTVMSDVCEDGKWGHGKWGHMANGVRSCKITYSTALFVFNVIMQDLTPLMRVFFNRHAGRIR